MLASAPSVSKCVFTSSSTVYGLQLSAGSSGVMLKTTIMEDIPVKPPLATDDQICIERQAMRLRDHPTVSAALAGLADYWLGHAQVSGTQRKLFDLEFERVTFCGLMDAVNSDPRHPGIHAFGRLEHMLDGVVVPATRTMHPNLDYIYRLIPLDGGSSLALTGRVVPGRAPLSIEYGMLTAGQVYQKTLALQDLVLGPAGEFQITVDARPADGRPNHFTSTQETHQLLLRDVLAAPGQWPLELQVVRDAALDVRPIDADAIAVSAITHIRRHIDGVLHINNVIALASAPNHFVDPRVHTDGIYSASQAYSTGNYRLAGDECLVIMLTLGSADYAAVPVTNLWGGVGDIPGQRSNLSTPTAARNPDGSYTFVVAHADPGQANWVQTAGEHEGVIFMRWVGLKQGATTLPTVQATVRKLEDVRREHAGSGCAEDILSARAARFREVMG